MLSKIRLFWLCFALTFLLNLSTVDAVEEATKDADTADSTQSPTTSSSSHVGAEVWLGTAPFCKVSSTDCQLFDLKFIRDDSTGNGATCWTGQKVLCRQKPLTSTFVASAPNELVVAVYNVNEPSFSQEHSGQTERTCHIPRALLNKFPDLDVIIIVELFIGGCVQHGQSNPQFSMGHMLANYGFGYATNVVGDESRSVFNTNGGVVIASRWPIISTREMVFTNYVSMDRFVGKGVVYAGINKHGAVFHVLGTQLQSGLENDEVRQEQAKELANFVSDLELPSKQPVIIGGDFQTDYLSNPEAVKVLVKEMFAEMSVIVGEVKVNVDYRSNELVQPEKNPQEWRDFVVFSSRHLAANQATMETTFLKSDAKIRFCNSATLQPTYVSPGSLGCRSEKTTNDLSDHYPVIGRLTFNVNEEELPHAHQPVPQLLELNQTAIALAGKQDANKTISTTP